MLKRLFSWKTIRRLVIGLACLATLIALALTVENIRAKQAWEAYKAELRAKGEKLDWTAFVPPPVPDEQNFAMIPLFRDLEYSPPRPANLFGNEGDKNQLVSVGIERPPEDKHMKRPELATPQSDKVTDLGEWQQFYRGNTNYPQANRTQQPAQDVLTALSRFEGELKQLSEAAQRPSSRFPIRYEDNISVNLPHLRLVKGCVKLLTLHAIAQLETGNIDGASHDVTVALRVAESTKDEPLLICHLVRLAAYTVVTENVKEGIARHAWREQDLAKLQELFSRIDLLADYEISLRGERAFSLEAIDLLRRGQIDRDLLTNPMENQLLGGTLFRAFYYQNLRTITQWHQELTLAIFDSTKHRVYPDVAEAGNRKFRDAARTPYNIFAKMLFPALVNSANRSAQTQATVDEAVISCALERYYLVNRHYPETLALLMPQFATKLPHDPVTGEPYKYRGTGNGFYILYSVGWDGKDDGGKVPAKKSNNSDEKQENSDWVWRYPGT